MATTGPSGPTGGRPPTERRAFAPAGLTAPPATPGPLLLDTPWQYSSFFELWSKGDRAISLWPVASTADRSDGDETS